MKLTVTVLLASAVAAFSQSASAQFAKPEDAVKYRQSALTLLSTHFGRIGAMANGRAPYDAKVAVENAELVQTLAQLPWHAFGPGTDKSRRAKPEIWTEQAKFKANSEKLIADTAKLAAAAKTNNLDNVKAAFTATAATCKSCHDTFRND